MDYQKLFDQVRNQFRVTFLCYGKHGHGFTRWLRKTDQHYGGYILWPDAVITGKAHAPLETFVNDNWVDHAVIIDPEDNKTARNAMLMMVYVSGNIPVVTGKESDDN